MGGYGGGGYGQGGYGGEPAVTLGPAYYQRLLTSQYQGSSPNLLTLVGVIVQKYEDIAQCILTMTQAFDINYAVGAQLDIVGANNGVSRTLPFQPTGGLSPVLDDPTYRLLIMATQAANNWNGEIDSLYGIWTNLFPGGNLTIVDNQNMTATISLSGTFTAIIQQLITNGLIVPRSETVEYTYTFATLPIFGFDQDNAFVAGFDLGHFS